MSYPIRSATTNNDLGFKLFEMDSHGSTIYSLFNKSSTLYVTGGVTEIPATTKVFNATVADMTVSGSDIYYAAMNATALLFYQNGSFVEGLTATTGVLSNHPLMATVVTGGNQYILYTGNDPEKSLFISSIPTGGVTLEESDLIYTYTGTGTTNYPSSSVAPRDSGTYQLVISVPEENKTYIGTSMPINFTITKREVTVNGISAENRSYSPGNVAVNLNVAMGILSGVIMEDEHSVTLDTGTATGVVATDDAGSGKSVTVTGFVLLGSKAGNYTLIQPTDVTVNIAPKSLTVPSVSLSADSSNGGLLITLSASVNSLGVGSYTVEIYAENDLKKTLTEINKDSAHNVPLESGIIEPETSYTAKAKAIADTSGNYTDSALSDQSTVAIAQYAPYILPTMRYMTYQHLKLINPLLQSMSQVVLLAAKLPTPL